MCGCENYACLNIVPDYSGCPTVITTDLIAAQTATYNWQYEFNGRWKGGTVDVTEGEAIVLPYVFNENYIHEIKFLLGGDLVNDTCYKLDTSGIPTSYSQNTGEDENTLTFEVTSDMLSTTTIDDVEYQVLTNPSINSREVALLADGNQIYNGFTQSGNALTMINGTTFYVGQKITLVFA
jgi:hypothetical protein